MIYLHRLISKTYLAKQVDRYSADLGGAVETVTKT